MGKGTRPNKYWWHSNKEQVSRHRKGLQPPKA